MRAWKNVGRLETAEIIFINGNRKATDEAARITGTCTSSIVFRLPEEFHVRSGMYVGASQHTFTGVLEIVGWRRRATWVVNSTMTGFPSAGKLRVQLCSIQAQYDLLVWRSTYIPGSTSLRPAGQRVPCCPGMFASYSKTAQSEVTITVRRQEWNRSQSTRPY